VLPELAHYGLILALCLAALQSIVPLVGAARGKLAWMHLARPLVLAQFLFIGFAFFSLAYAFVSNDFSLAYVAENSNSTLPLFYRFCAVWGAHEGSLLLWVFILNFWALLVSIFSRHLPIQMMARVLAVMGMISFGFLLFSLQTSDPFVRIFQHVPLNGHDLNPLLQDPGLAVHPPMLYMGYVGFSVAFAFAIAGLISGRFDAAWARWSRPWTLAAWCFLTLGIVLGSWWAYRELGWGGWWFWDPVENASFLPWLVATALIHSLAVAEQRNTFKAWTVLLAICTFSLSLLGTFLVRSGVLVSVHAFAVDPQRGAFMIKFLTIVVGGSLLLFAWRAYAIRSTARFQFWSRETMLLANNLLFMVAMATVLLGTLYPLVIQALGLGKLSVGPPYFNTVFIPIMIPLLVLMGPAPLWRWQQNDPWAILRRLRLSLLLAVVLGLMIPWFVVGQLQWSVMLALSLTLWIILTTLQNLWTRQHGKLRRKKYLRHQYGMMLAHIGMAICVIGVVFSSVNSVRRDVRLQPGDQVTVGRYQFKLLGVRQLRGPNYTAVEAGVEVLKQGKQVTILTPELRYYPVQKTALAKSSIDAGVFRDVYVALAGPAGDNGWALRIFYKPLVRWIWGGGLLMLFGGLLAATRKRYWLKEKIKKTSPLTLQTDHELNEC